MTEYKVGQILNFTWGGVFGNLIQIYNKREYKEKGPITYPGTTATFAKNLSRGMKNSSS